MPNSFAVSIKKELSGLRSLIRFVVRNFSSFGIDIVKVALSLRGLPIVIGQYFELKRQNAAAGGKWLLKFGLICPGDRYDTSGVVSGHYFHQDLLVARRIFEANPKKHVDVGSRIDGFVAHVASFRTIEVLDIRPMGSDVMNIKSRVCDVMVLPEEYHEYCDSLSCLHALEHFGLGRYGDPLDIDGYLRGFAGLKRLLKAGGTLYLSVPIGRQQIEFNAHRVFSIRTILDMVSSDFVLSDFSYVDDSGDLHASVHLDDSSIENDLSLQYGCGIFELLKRSRGAGLEPEK